MENKNNKTEPSISILEHKKLTKFSYDFVFNVGTFDFTIIWNEAKSTIEVEYGIDKKLELRCGVSKKYGVEYEVKDPTLEYELNNSDDSDFIKIVKLGKKLTCIVQDKLYTFVRDLDSLREGIEGSDIGVSRIINILDKFVKRIYFKIVDIENEKR